MAETAARAPVGPTASESRLIDAAIAGDAAAFADLYDLHVARVYRHCYYRCANRADAEDLTQQTFLQAWRAIGRFRRGGAPFVAWLLTIAHNLAISSARKRRELTLSTVDVTPASREDGPEVAAIRTDERDAVRQAILQLKPDRQQVIILRFIEGFSGAETAAALGKSENNIRVLQHRALADLRKRLTALAPSA